MLDMHGTINGVRAIKAQHEPPQRLARVVIALSIGLSLCVLGASPASSGSLNAIDPKTYIKLHYSHREAICLIRLYGKESAFNSKAIGNDSGRSKAYGIPQLKNPLIKDLSPNRQIDYGMKYIAHRYMGSPCYALLHSNRYGWY